MRLLVINSSPRKHGFSVRFVDEAVKGFKEIHPDAEVVSFYLNDLDMKGCQHCGICKGDEEVAHCTVEDGLHAVLGELAVCDAVLVGVPNYMGTYNAQLKTLLDRTYGFIRKDWSSRLKADQKTGVIIVQGNPDAEMYKKVEEELVSIFSRRGQREAFGITIAGRRGVGGSDAKEEDLARARELGKKL